MKVPGFILGAAVTAALALQAWTLSEVVKLKVEMAALNATVAGHVKTAADLTKN